MLVVFGGGGGIIKSVGEVRGADLQAQLFAFRYLGIRCRRIVFGIQQGIVGEGIIVIDHTRQSYVDGTVAKRRQLFSLVKGSGCGKQHGSSPYIKVDAFLRYGFIVSQKTREVNTEDACG